VNAGTAVLRLVDVTVETSPRIMLNETRSFTTLVSKLVPVTVTAVPIAPIAGVKLVIVGAVEAATMKAVALVADPFGATTPIVPVVAPLGTVTLSVVAVAPATTAVVPLKATAF
jgi:hypothetical protein